MTGREGRWISLDEVFREYERDAAQWMSERDRRLAAKTRDEPRDDRRRVEQAEHPREEPT